MTAFYGLLIKVLPSSKIKDCIALVLALASVVCGIISRKNLGYFDKLSLAGIIIGIFGIVFSVVGLFFGDIIKAFLS